MKIHKKITVLIGLILFVSLNLHADELDEIISKHIQAHGGYDNWMHIESLKITGTFTGFSIPSEFTTIRKRPNLYRSDYGLSKFDVVEAYDGKSGWTINPWFDVSFPRLLNASEENVMVQKAEFCTPFFNYKERGHTVAYEGTDEVDGMATLKLKLTRNTGHVEIWYLDASTYLEVKQESVWDDFGFPIRQETFFDDFRKVGKVTMPFYIDRSFGIRNRILELEQVEINPALDAELFSLPLSAAMEKLKSLEGSWSVVVEAPGRKGWRKTDSCTSHIGFFGHTSLLQANLSYENYHQYEKLISWSFNATANNYSMTVFDGFSSQLLIFKGQFANDSLIFDNLADGTGQTDLDVTSHEKYILSAISAKTFVLDIKHSGDKGQTWTDYEKLTFSRLD